MTYRERASVLDGAIAWQRVADGRDTWVLPDGCMDIIWDGRSLLVAGPDRGPHLATAAMGTSFVALRFAPGTGPAVFGVPADALRDQRVPLADIWPVAAVERIAESLHDALPEDQTRVLEQAAASRLEDSEPDAMMGEVARLVGAGRPVSVVADAVGLSERQLHRRCMVAFGYGAKVLARILRLQRALALARMGTPFAATAFAAGYADQAHLAREVRALAGAPLSHLT